MRLPPLQTTRAERARRDFAYFVDLVAPQLTRTPYHTALDAILTEAATVGGFYLITAPPQTGKSERISRLFPAYMFAKRLQVKMITASYADSLALRNSRDVKRILRSDLYQRYFGIAIQPGEDRDDSWRTDHGGEFLCGGIRSGLTGNPANVLLTDDTLKNAIEAASKTTKDRVWEEWVSTLNTRVSPMDDGYSLRVDTATRWDGGDLHGRLKELTDRDADAYPFTSYRFPAIRDEDMSDAHPLDTRALGEALWPGRHSVADLQRVRALSERNWLALYQGVPPTESGNLFKAYWLSFFRTGGKHDPAPNPHIVVGPEGEDHACPQIPFPDRAIVGKTISVDCAFKGTAGSDFVGIGLWERTADDRHFQTQLLEERLTFQDTVSVLRRWIAEYNPGKVIVEDAANGAAVMDTLWREFGEQRILARPTKGGKVARANAVLPYFEQGKVFLPHPQQAGWVHKFLGRLSAFPSPGDTVPDDTVDQMTHYLAWRMETKGGTIRTLRALAY